MAADTHLPVADEVTTGLLAGIKVTLGAASWIFTLSLGA